MSDQHPAEAVAAAEAEARQAHEAGRCHLSEWTCSYCEAEAEGDA